MGKVRSHGGIGPSNGHGNIMKKRGCKDQTGSGSGKSDGMAKKSFCNEAERTYLVALIAERLLGHAILFAKVRAIAIFSIAGPVCTAHTDHCVFFVCFVTAVGADLRPRHSLGL